MVAIEAHWQSLSKNLDGILKLYFAPKICSQVYDTSPQMDRRKDVLLDRKLQENDHRLRAMQ